MFDHKKFMKASFTPREEAVAVPDLAEYFADGTQPLWRVRGLTGHELGQVNEAKDRSKNIEAVLEALVSDKPAEKKDALCAVLGMDGSTPVDIVRRLELLKIGSVDPKCDHDLAVRLCTYFPVEFMLLTNKITQLTGQGATVKKKQTPSGAAPK